MNAGIDRLNFANSMSGGRGNAMSDVLTDRVNTFRRASESNQGMTARNIFDQIISGKETTPLGPVAAATGKPLSFCLMDELTFATAFNKDFNPVITSVDLTQVRTMDQSNCLHELLGSAKPIDGIRSAIEALASSDGIDIKSMLLQQKQSLSGTLRTPLEYALFMENPENVICFLNAFKESPALAESLNTDIPDKEKLGAILVKKGIALDLLTECGFVQN